MQEIQEGISCQFRKVPFKPKSITVPVFLLKIPISASPRGNLRANSHWIKWNGVEWILVNEKILQYCQYFYFSAYLD